MSVPTLKPIRIPPTISEEDKKFLTIKRHNQNNVYQLTVLFIELLRKNQSAGQRLIRVAFNQAHRYVFPEVVKQQIEEYKEKQEQPKSSNDCLFDNHKINSIGE